MFYAHWVFALILSTGQHGTGEITRQIPMTHEACMAYVEKYKDHMQDYIRGWSREDLEDDVEVRGNCVPVPNPGERPAL